MIQRTVWQKAAIVLIGVVFTATGIVLGSLNAGAGNYLLSFGIYIAMAILLASLFTAWNVIDIYDKSADNA